MNKEQLNKWQENLLQTIMQLERVYDNIIELEVIKKIKKNIYLILERLQYFSNL